MLAVGLLHLQSRMKQRMKSTVLAARVVTRLFSGWFALNIYKRKMILKEKKWGNAWKGAASVHERVCYF